MIPTRRFVKAKRGRPVLCWFLQTFLSQSLTCFASSNYLVFSSARGEQMCADNVSPFLDNLLAEHCKQVCQQRSNSSSLANLSSMLGFVFVTVTGCLMSCYWLAPFFCSVDHLRSGCSSHTDGGGDGGQAAAPRHGQVSMMILEPRATKRQMLNPSSVIFHGIPDMTFADFKPQSVKSYTVFMQKVVSKRWSILWNQASKVISLYHDAFLNIKILLRDNSWKTL